MRVFGVYVCVSVGGGQQRGVAKAKLVQPVVATTGTSELRRAYRRAASCMHATLRAVAWWRPGRKEGVTC